MKNIIIMKFGGSCLKNSESFMKILNIIEKFKKENTHLIFVCSAVSGITNYLLDVAQKMNLNKRINPLIYIDKLYEKHSEIIESVIKDKWAKDADNFIRNALNELKIKYKEIQKHGITEKRREFIASYGERLSTYIFTQFLKYKGISTEYISADDEFILINRNNLPLMELTENYVREKLSYLINKNIYPSITGYIARNEDGEIVTLGRGGSDFTTTLVASCIQGEADYNVKIILWKDVHGLYTSDPRLISSAKLIPYISYAEARELAFFGTKILHPLCIFPAEGKNVPIEIRCFDHFESENFTTIGPAKHIKLDIIKAISVMKDVAMITVEGEAMVSRPGTAAKVFDLMGNNNVNILMISQASSENNITFLVSRDDGEKAKDVLINSDFFGGSHFLKLKRELNVSLLAVVGAGMQYTPGVAGRIFTALGKNNVNIRAIAQGSSELNISMVILKKDIKEALQAIYEEFRL
ncbi:MAG: aspartate kinase [Candidatus Helarchaeota archaeon]